MLSLRFIISDKPAFHNLYAGKHRCLLLSNLDKMLNKRNSQLTYSGYITIIILR